MKATLLIIWVMAVASVILAMPLIVIMALNQLFDTGIPLNQWSYLSMALLMIITAGLVRKGD
jgi:hypothetical protein